MSAVTITYNIVKIKAEVKINKPRTGTYTQLKLTTTDISGKVDYFTFQFRGDWSLMFVPIVNLINGGVNALERTRRVQSHEESLNAGPPSQVG